MRRVKKSRGLIAALVLNVCARPTNAEEFRVPVACPAWGSEQVAQVEARIRAAVLLEDAPPGEVQVTCHETVVTVAVRTSAGTAERPVERTSPSLEDDIVREVDAALRELNQPPTQPAPVPSPAPSPPAEPAPAPPVVVTPAPVVSAPVRTDTPSWLELSGGGGIERWAKHWALGFEVAPSLGDDRVRYGVRLGGSWALREGPRFDVVDAHAAVEAALQPHFAAGIRGSAALGLSQLSVTPSGSLSAETATAYGAAFVQLRISRPIWFGAFALAPSLGVRAHLAERRVLVDDVKRLALPLFVPQAQLSLIWSRRPPF